MPFNKEKGEQEIQSEDTIFQIIFLFFVTGDLYELRNHKK